MLLVHNLNEYNLNSLKKLIKIDYIESTRTDWPYFIYNSFKAVRERNLDYWIDVPNYKTLVKYILHPELIYNSMVIHKNGFDGQPVFYYYENGDFKYIQIFDIKLYSKQLRDIEEKINREQIVEIKTGELVCLTNMVLKDRFDNKIILDKEKIYSIRDYISYIKNNMNTFIVNMKNMRIYNPQKRTKKQNSDEDKFRFQGNTIQFFNNSLRDSYNDWRVSFNDNT